jgi:predicted type IV restriction endonuclease
MGLMQENSQVLMADLSAFASGQIERNLETLKQLAAAKSHQAALEIHVAYLRQTVTELSAVSHRAGGLYIETLRQWARLFSMR